MVGHVTGNTRYRTVDARLGLHRRGERECEQQALAKMVFMILLRNDGVPIEIDAEKRCADPRVNEPALVLESLHHRILER